MKKSELIKLIENKVRKVLNEITEPTYTKITGYVGNKKVVACVYPGKDSDLSHYRIENGPSKVGTVKFTSITKEEKIKY